MSGRISAAVVQAMALITDPQHPVSPYAAAKAVGIALSTIYRSSLYKAYKAGQTRPPAAPITKETP